MNPNIIPIICTVLVILSGAVGWMFVDRLHLAEAQGAIKESIRNQKERLVEIATEQKGFVSRHEHADLQESVREGIKETKEEMGFIRTELGTMAKIMARATGDNAIPASDSG